MASQVVYRLGGVVQVVAPIADDTAYRGAQKVRGRAISNIRSLGRVDSGRMIAGLQVRRVNRGDGLRRSYEVASTARAADGFNYPAAQEHGTRAHGPRVAPAMVFTPKGSSVVVFAQWVRGVTPGNFMLNAWRGTTVGDFLP